MVNITYGGFRTDANIVPGASFSAGMVLVPTANGYAVSTSTSQYSGHAYRVVDPNYNSARRDVVGLNIVSAFGGPLVVDIDSALITGSPAVGNLINTLSGSFTVVTSSGFGEVISVANGVISIELY